MTHGYIHFTEKKSSPEEQAEHLRMQERIQSLLDSRRRPTKEKRKTRRTNPFRFLADPEAQERLEAMCARLELSHGIRAANNFYGLAIAASKGGKAAVKKKMRQIDHP